MSHRRLKYASPTLLRPKRLVQRTTSSVKTTRNTPHTRMSPSELLPPGTLLSRAPLTSVLLNGSKSAGGGSGRNLACTSPRHNRLVNWGDRSSSRRHVQWLRRPASTHNDERDKLRREHMALKATPPKTSGHPSQNGWALHGIQQPAANTQSTNTTNHQNSSVRQGRVFYQKLQSRCEPQYLGFE